MATNVTSPPDTIHGWVHEPNGRGTFEILWTCIQTVVLCAWVSVCVNIPAPGFGAWDVVRDKFHFVLLTLLGPEIVIIIAYGQYLSAKSSVAQFGASNYKNWTMIHAFYADMGGIIVRPPDWKQFPVDTKQLHYLVTRDYMDFPDLTTEEIQARGKTDKLARLITIVQTLYFLASTFARIDQHLAITTLELTVVGFIGCTLVMNVFWWNKPNDVDLAHSFPLKVPLRDILKEAGDAGAAPYRDTPLDFLSINPWAGTTGWCYWVNILRSMGLFPAWHNARPIDKFTSFDFKKPPRRWHALLIFAIGTAYTSTFFVAWNFYFPTEIELYFWRAVTIAQVSATVLTGAIEIPLYHSWLPPRPGDCSAEREQSDSTLENGLLRRHTSVSTSVRNLWNKRCNNSPDKHESLDIPLRMLLVTTPACALYTVCRVFIIMEDLVSLRSNPPSVFLNVEWTRYWPSF